MFVKKKSLESKQFVTLKPVLAGIALNSSGVTGKGETIDGVELIWPVNPWEQTITKGVVGGTVTNTSKPVSQSLYLKVNVGIGPPERFSINTFQQKQVQTGIINYFFWYNTFVAVAFTTGLFPKEASYVPIQALHTAIPLVAVLLWHPQDNVFLQFEQVDIFFVGLKIINFYKMNMLAFQVI